MSDHQFQFRPPYLLSGTPGAAIGPLRQSLPELGAASLLLDLRSTSADTLRITQIGGPAPDYLQPITLWDADGRRVFTGHATEVDEQWDGTQSRTSTTVSGPWWWLEQTQLTSFLTDALGGEQERPVFTFPSQDLSTSIRALLDRLTAMGIPLRAGEIAATFPVPQMQFANGTAESVLTTLLQWLPDAATSIRYDAGGIPALDVHRRPTAPTLTLDLTTPEITRASIPRLTEIRHLTPTQVCVQTMEVDATGQILYGQDIAGDPHPPTPVGRQILPLSGPGRSDFAPYTPRVAAIQTQTLSSVGAANIAAMWAVARVLDPVIAKAEEEYGAITFTSFGNPAGLTAPPPGIVGSGAHHLISGTHFEWMETELSITQTTTRLYGWLYGTYPNTGWTGATNHLISRSLAWGGFVSPHYMLAVFVDFTIPTLNTDFATLSVLVHPADRALVTPIPGLAANLFAAQAYTPFQGSVPLHPGSPLPLPGTRLSIRGGLPKWAAMGAMTHGLSLDLRTGLATASLGRPPRTAATSLLTQFARPLSGKVILA